MKYDPTCRYAESHEWVRVQGGQAEIGISDFAQSELNDVVYVELPQVGDTLSKGEEFGSVESVKAASELYAPVSGQVIEINETLQDTPELINQDPFGKGWLLRVQLADPTELDDLMDAQTYQAQCEQD